MKRNQDDTPNNPSILKKAKPDAPAFTSPQTTDNSELTELRRQIQSLTDQLRSKPQQVRTEKRKLQLLTPNNDLIKFSDPIPTSWCTDGRFHSGTQHPRVSAALVAWLPNRLGSLTTLGESPISKPRWSRRSKRRTTTHERNSLADTSHLALSALREMSSNMNVEINVLNDVTLSEIERIILGMGLNWIPQPLFKKVWNFDKSYQDFERNVRLRYFFLHQESFTEKDSPELKLHRYVAKQLSFEEKQAIFTPPKASKVLEHYLKTLKSNLSLLCSKKLASNQSEFSKAIIAAIHALKARKDIVIKNSDKNKGTVVMSYEHYHKEALGIKQLGDPNTYKRLHEMEIPSHHTFMSGLKAVFEHQKCFSEYTANRLFKDLHADIKVGLISFCLMYFLPKLGKKEPEMRPICASIGCPTYNSSKYLDVILQPFIQTIPYATRNSAELITEIENLDLSDHNSQLIPDDGDDQIYLVDMDVTKLYPSIVIEDGLRSLRAYLKEIKIEYDKENFLCKLAAWVLRNNYVTFGKHVFLQIKGTAMGTPFAVCFACIHMYQVEKECLFIFRHQGLPCGCLKFYRRFIDDLLVIIRGHQVAELFIEIFNGIRDSIKFTSNINKNSVNYLNVTIYKGERYAYNRLDTTLFQKEGSKFLFVAANSFHPHHVFRAWPTDYLIQLRLICSSNDEYEKVRLLFYERLCKRKYDQTELHKIFNSIPSRDIILQNLYNKMTQKQDDFSLLESKNSFVRFKLDYSPEIARVLPVIKRILNTAEVCEFELTAKEIFGKGTYPSLCLKNSPSLSKILVRAEFKEAS